MFDTLELLTMRPFTIFYLFPTRHKWKINKGICQLENTERQMTITKCEGGKEFTCNDGTCVDIYQV